MKLQELLKKAGQKAAVASIDPRCFPYVLSQPTPPKSILKKMQGK